MSLAPNFFLPPSPSPKQSVVFIGQRANDFINLLCDSQSSNAPKELELKQDIGKARINQNELLLKNGNQPLAMGTDANTYLNKYKAVILCPKDLADLKRYTDLITEDKQRFYAIMTDDATLIKNIPSNLHVTTLQPPQSANEELRTSLLGQILKGLLALLPKPDNKPDSSPAPFVRK